MQVLIDGQPLDVTLETEKTLSQVVAGVDSYLMGHGLTITGLDVDNDSLELDQLSVWGSRAIGEISEIRMETQPQWELTLAHLVLVHRFLSDWLTAIEADEPDAVRLLVAEQSDLARHLEEHVGLIFSDLPSSALPGLFSVTGDADLMVAPPGGRERISRELGALIPLIEQRIAEIRQPARIAATTAGLITGMMGQLQDISVMLQTGKDQEAMTIVVRFTEILEKLLRTLPHLARVDRDFSAVYHDNSSLATAGADLNVRLHELVEAFSSQDTVLIGDLLEYEIVPRLEELIAVIPAETGE